MQKLILKSSVICSLFITGFLFHSNLEAQTQANKKPIQSKRLKQKAKSIDFSAEQKKQDQQSEKRQKEIQKDEKHEGAAITSIHIKGQKKIEVDAITTKIISKVGDHVETERIRADVEALFKTGFFYDVKVDQKNVSNGAELTYIVVEKPSVTDITYSGYNELELDELKEAANLKTFEILNMTKIREAVEKMQKAYEEKGFFLAKVTPQIIPVVEGESVKINFEIQENDKVKVKRVTFIGNQNISDQKLKSFMETQEGGFFSFVSSSGSYKQDKFDRDVQLLNYAYFNEGYMQVKVDRPQVYVTPDKKGIYITIYIEEGNRFKVGTIDFAGDLLFDKDDLNNSIEINKLTWYQHDTVLKDLRALTAKYGDLGYAYANIIPRTRTRDKDKEVDITFEIDKGDKVYFHRINVVGNSRTRDKVIRRELQIREGELYNETRKRESYDSVKRLGYFEDVNFNTSTPAEGADLMDVEIVVKERNTGTIQVGAGYSTYSNFIFNGKVDQINLLGRGQKLGAAIEFSSNNRNINLSFNEPYLYDSKWSFGINAYDANRNLLNYYDKRNGAQVNLGHPLAPFLRGYVAYKYEYAEISLTSPTLSDGTVNPDYNPDLYKPSATGDTSSVTLSIEYDKRNDRFMPTQGMFSSASVEYAGLGGSKKYTKSEVTYRYYKKIFWDMVLRNNFVYGAIKSTDPVQPDEPGVTAVPFNLLYRLGGSYSLRGFDPYSIGKKKFSSYIYNLIKSKYTDDQARALATKPFGGTQELYYQAEVEFPLITEAGIKGVIFYDVGQAEDDIIVDRFRSDVGFGFRWFSPIGPLRFEWGFPLAIQSQYGERPVNFQFAIGSPF